MASDVRTTLVDWSPTSGSNLPTGSTSVSTNLDDCLREIQGVVVRGFSHKGADIASATSTDIGAVEGLFHDITGDTTITGLGTVRAGILKILKFEGALTLTHNATSLILPGGANITTANGDVAFVFSEGSGNWRCLSYFKAASLYITAASTDTLTNKTLTEPTLTSPVLNTGVSGTAIADAAETLTGTSTTKVITPGGFAGNLDITGAEGYYKIPGGLILQWNSLTTDVNGNSTWTFPAAFSTACFYAGGQIASGADDVHMTIQGPSTTAVVFQSRTVAGGPIGSRPFRAFAIGV